MRKFISLSIIANLMLSMVGCGSGVNSEIESNVNNSESKISEIESTEEVKVTETVDTEIETTTAIEVDSNDVDKNDKSESDYFEITDYRIENDYYWNDYEHGAKITFVVRNISDKELTFEAAELLFVKENEIIIPEFSSDCGVKLEPNQATEFEVLVDYPDEYIRYEVVNYIYSTDSESYVEKDFSEKYVIDLNANEENKNEELTEYTINQISFSVPKTYKVLKEEENIITFQITDDNKDRLMIKSEKIPDIMKINTNGENDVLTKEDTVEYGSLSHSVRATKSEWLKNFDFECYDVYFDREDDERNGRYIVIPINENDAYFTALAMTKNKDELNCVENVIKSIDVNDLTKCLQENENKATNVEKYYSLAINLLPDDCLKFSNESEALVTLIDNMPLILTDYDGSPLTNKNDVEKSTLYLSLFYGMVISAASDMTSDYKIMPHITNKTFKSQSDLLSYANDCASWMTANQFAVSFFEKINTLDCSKISKKDNTYTCVISDTAKCAEELNISEEMLGYIIAALEDYGTSTRFDGIRCEIEYKDYDNRINLS